MSTPVVSQEFALKVLKGFQRQIKFDRSNNTLHVTGLNGQGEHDVIEGALVALSPAIARTVGRGSVDINNPDAAIEIARKLNAADLNFEGAGFVPTDRRSSPAM